jgi:hypothetical protein
MLPRECVTVLCLSDSHLAHCFAGIALPLVFTSFALWLGPCACRCVLSAETMADILAHGHSRIPVYSGSRHNVQGYLLTKRLIVIDPEDNRELDSLFSFRYVLLDRVVDAHGLAGC